MGLLNYQIIELEKGHDSTPIICKDIKNNIIISFHKEYGEKDLNGKCISRNGLKVYSYIHRILSGKNHKIEFNQPFKFNGIIYKGISRNVVDLNPQEIYDGSKVSNKERILITYPDYLEGPTLETYENKDFEYKANTTSKRLITSSILGELVADVNQKINTIFTTYGLKNKPRISVLNGKNVKVISVNGEYLGLTITDLGNQIFSVTIPENLDSYKEIKRLLNQNNETS